MMGSQSFNKEERLRGKDSIDEVFKQGKTFYLHPFKILFIKKDEGQIGVSRLVIVVGKRNFRKACDRNLLKRRIREAYRTNKKILTDQLIKLDEKCTFILIYKASTILAYSEIRKKIILTLQRLSDEYEKVDK